MEDLKEKICYKDSVSQEVHSDTQRIEDHFGF